jgi:crotonobetainyl-CoA:carnitine CoA-transferase CaiB-like acyl-CoA transferase
MRGPLEGLTVIAVEQAVAAPLCSMRLADAGARVIKVERPEGDFARGYDRAALGQSSYFVWLNRGKESIALDLRSEADLGLLRRMLARADVLVQNLAPGALDRMGLGAESLKTLNPRLINCAITGYGEGPYRNRKAYDLLIQAESGLASVTGGPDGMARVGVSVCDIASGMYAHAAILEALIARGISGRGAVIEVSLFDAMAEWMAVPLLQAEGSGRNPPRLGLHHPSIAPYGVYACGDGNAVLLSVQSAREWRAFCAGVLGDPDLADAPGFATHADRVANRPALDARIDAAFSALGRDAAIALLEAAGIAFASLNAALDLARHPHLRRVAVMTPGGEVAPPAPPARVEGAHFAAGPVPAIDAHGAAIRAEFAQAGGGVGE